VLQTEVKDVDETVDPPILLLELFRDGLTPSLELLQLDIVVLEFENKLVLVVEGLQCQCRSLVVEILNDLN